MNKKDFADFVKEKRKELNLTQEELAEKLNVSRYVVSKWEGGKRYPDMETSQQLAHVLGVTPTELYEKSSVNDINSPIKAAYIIAPIVVLIALIGLVIIPLATNRDDVIIDTPANIFNKTEPQYYMDMYSAASEDRYYYVNDGALVYYEKATSDIKYLCSKENCDHKNDSCNARAILADKATKAMWYYKDRLYMVERDTEWDRLVSYNLEGEDKKNHTILTVDGFGVYSSNSANSLCFNDGYVYYIASNAAELPLYRASIDDGSTPELLTKYENSAYNFPKITLTAMSKMVYINVEFSDAQNTSKKTYSLDYYDVANNKVVNVWETDNEENDNIVCWSRNDTSKNFVFDNDGNMYYATEKDNEYTINKYNVYTKQQEKFYSMKCNTYKPENKNTGTSVAFSVASDSAYINLQMFDGKYFYVTRGVNLTKNKSDFIADTIRYGSDNSKSLVTKVNTNYIFVIDKDGTCVDIKEMQVSGTDDKRTKQTGNMPIDLFVGNETRFIMKVNSQDAKTDDLYEGSIVDGSISVNKVEK